MGTIREPQNTDELRDLVLDHARVLPVGGLTKSRLCATEENCQPISTRHLTGITEYHPSEYTFTAYAGTTVREIQEALRAKDQFLPCSAMRIEAGATLGGAVASGLSGSGRFRFGGLRDFLLGIRFLSGQGTFISAGGKVVKNAAGFDLPKFMVGSLGRFGILTELTFKVFPRPSATHTLQVQCQSHAEAVERLAMAASSRWELYAIDYNASETCLYLCVGGPEEAVDKISSQIMATWNGEVQAGVDAYWQETRELAWGEPDSIVAKVPVTPRLMTTLQERLDTLQGVTGRYSSAGNVAYLAVADSSFVAAVDEILKSLSLRGLVILGKPPTPLWLGLKKDSRILASIKNALDPEARFPAIDHED